MLKKRYIIIALGIVSVLVGSLFYNNIALSKEEGEPTSIEVTNLPLDEQGNLKVKLADEELWEKIYGLQATVDSMNASLIELQDRIGILETIVSELEAENPEIITVNAYPNWMLLFRDVWTDLLIVSDVTVTEDTTVIVMAVVNFRCTEGADLPLTLRFRANNTYSEERYQGSAEPYNTEIVEMHHTWTNIPAGTYTFALQYHVYYLRTIYVRMSRLTLLIFPQSVS